MEILDRNKLEAQRKFLKIYFWKWNVSLKKKKNTSCYQGAELDLKNASLKQWL